MQNTRNSICIYINTCCRHNRHHIFQRASRQAETAHIYPETHQDKAVNDLISNSSEDILTPREPTAHAADEARCASMSNPPMPWEPNHLQAI